MDSRIETQRHIETVQQIMAKAIADLQQRSLVHDQSKLASPEVEIFDEFTDRLKTSTYGSDEYKSFLAQMKPALDHHYSSNDHHPEHYRWHCPICKLNISDSVAATAPEGPNDTGVKYCPQCCKHGMIYETELMLKTDGGLQGMSLVSLLEMLCDWLAATRSDTMMATFASRLR